MSEVSKIGETGRILETVLVTGSRLATTVDRVPAHVTVIDRELIEARGDQSLVDLLRSVAGLQVSQNGGRGGIASVFVRGAEPNFTLVFIDGVKVNDPNNTRGGSFDFSNINVEEVERVEVIRGAQSAIYGSDGLAGVINIVTRRTADEVRGNLSAEVGRDDFWRLGATAAGPVGEVTQWSLTGSAVDDGDGLEGSSFESQALDGRLTSQPTESTELDFTLRYFSSDATSFPEDSGGPEYAELRALDSRDQSQLHLAFLLGQRIGEKWSIRAKAGYLESEEDFDSPGVAEGVRSGVPPNSSDSRLERVNVNGYAVYDGGGAVRATVGLDWEDEHGDATGEVEFAPGFALPTDFELNREILGAFTEWEVDLRESVMFTAAVRRDEPDGQSGETTGRIGAQFRFANTRLFGSWSQGFKLPSFFALGNALVGNPDLLPETSETFEIGISQTAADGALDLTLAVFASEYEDLIDFDFELFANVNRDRVDTSGFEVDAGWQASDALRLTGQISYVDIDVKDSDTTLRQRPEWRGGASLFWSLTDTLEFVASWIAVGEVFDSSIPTGGLELDAYNQLDMRLSWAPAESMGLWLAVDNLFDEQYEEAIGFPALGISPRLGMRWSF